MNFLKLFGARLGGQPVEIPQMTAGRLLTNGLNLVYFVTGITAVIVIILAGYRYATAAGNSEKMKKSLTTIAFASAGLVIIILAFAITNFVVGQV